MKIKIYMAAEIKFETAKTPWGISNVDLMLLKVLKRKQIDLTTFNQTKLFYIPM